MELRAAGTQICVHPLMLLLPLLALRLHPGAAAGATALSLALHEAAHLAAARGMGVRVESLRLMPFGGQAVLGNLYALSPIQLFTVAAAGPAANMGLTLVSAALCQWGVIDPLRAGLFQRINLALMLFTGMRRGEVLGLRWEDIDFDNKLIRVRRAVSYPTNQPLVSTPKTRSGNRVIPLDDQLTALLEPKGTTGYVIGGEKPLTQMVLRRILRQINKKVDMFGATPHVFRHSFATMLNDAGASVKTIQSIIGQKDFKTTADRYCHPRDNRKQEAVEGVDKLLCS